jgi:hypothetical protein
MATGRKRAHKELTPHAAEGSRVSAASLSVDPEHADPWARFALSVDVMALMSPDRRLLESPGAASDMLRSIVGTEAEAVRHMRHTRALFHSERVAGALAFDAAIESALEGLRETKDARSADSESATTEATDGDDEANSFPPRYTGRPAEGYTSGALYLAAEHYCGCPPLKRSGWRDIAAESALLSSTFQHAVERDGQSGGQSWEEARAMAALSPAVARQTADALRQPAFPDRAYPLPVHGRGARMARHIAIAADMDTAAAEEGASFEMQERALLSMLRHLPTHQLRPRTHPPDSAGSEAPDVAAGVAAHGQKPADSAGSHD